MIMKRTMIALIVFLTAMVCSGGHAADITATPETYKVIINTVRMWNDTDGQWYTASTGDTCFDITAAEVDCSCGCYCTDIDLPDGTYTYIEITMSRTFQIKSKVDDPLDGFGGGAGKTWYTTTTTTGGDISCSMDNGNYALGTAVIQTPAGWTSTGDYMHKSYKLPASMVITGETARTVRINFAVASSVKFTGLSSVIWCVPKAPDIKITQVE